MFSKQINLYQARLMGAASMAALITAGAAGAARAQGADAASQPQTGSAVQEVVVTGSRLTAAGFTTPTPVTVLSGAAMQTLNLTNVGQAINELPSFRASNTPTTNGFGSFNVGAQIVNLYGLGVNRSLVLVDGRRLPPVTRENTVDLNQIPSEMVDRTEVVTGGASAAYGSDAVAGAVNIILNKKLTGLKGQADYGISQVGDGSDYHLSLAGGSDFAGNRGHFVAGGEYENQNGIGNCFTRRWCQPSQIVTNAGADSVPGQPAFIRADSNAGYFANQNGVVSIINNSPPSTAAIRNLFGTGGVTFTPTGAPVGYALGAPGSGNSVVGGNFTPSQTFTQLLVPVERHTFYGHADYNLTETVKTFGELSYAHVGGMTQQSSYFGAPISIFADNPFVPAQIRALIGAAPATPSGTRPAAGLFNLAILGQRRGVSSSTADSYRVAGGFDAKLNERFSVDGYYQFSHTSRNQSVANDLVTGAGRVINAPGGGISNAGSYDYFAWATDAVVSPGGTGLPAAGMPTCRALISPDAALRAAAAGCTPYNPFGSSSVPSASLDYVYRTLTETIDIDQHAAGGNIQAKLFDLPAGPVAATAGVEYRHDTDKLVHDPLSTVFAYFQNFGADYNAHDDVVEVFGEAAAPILRDQPFAKNLSLDGAIRQAHYNVAGFGSYNQAASSLSFDATTWKVGVVYEPTDWLRLRASTSRDVRAPNLFDLFQASASNFTSVANRFAAGSPAQFPATLAGGNPALVPEKATTNTYGFVLQPRWGWTTGLRLSVDYFDIRVDDYIGTSGAQNIVDQCYYFKNPQMCALIKFGAANAITEIDNTNVNLQWLRTQGFDVEADYRLPLAKLKADLPGAVTFRLLGTNTRNSSTNLFGTVTNQAGVDGAGGIPQWILNMYGTYSAGPINLTLQGRYITPGLFDPTKIGPRQSGYSVSLPNSINNNYVDGAFYLNLNASYDVIQRADKRLQVFASIRNLLDAAPPSDPQTAYSTNPIYFDQIGRYFRLGVRFNY
jgi:iron complex outermembrane receptor protein